MKRWQERGRFERVLIGATVATVALLGLEKTGVIETHPEVIADAVQTGYSYIADGTVSAQGTEESGYPEVHSPSTGDEEFTTDTPTTTVPAPTKKPSASPSTDPSTGPVATTSNESVIMAVGDICKSYGCRTTGKIVTRQRSSSEGLDAFLTLGDNQYESGTYSEFKRLYDPALGKHKDITLANIGNHEMRDNGNGYYKYFFGGDRSKQWYFKQVGSWLIVMVNSETSLAANSAQGKWLKNTLENSDAKCKLVTQHTPRWNVGKHGHGGQVTALNKIMVQGGVDVNLAGHDHNYQRWKPMDNSKRVTSDGMRNYVVGTGGATRYGLGSDPSHLDKTFSGRIGVLRMTLRDGSYTSEFVDANGNASDKVNGTCANDR